MRKQTIMRILRRKAMRDAGATFSQRVARAVAQGTKIQEVKFTVEDKKPVNKEA